MSFNIHRSVVYNEWFHGNGIQHPYVSVIQMQTFTSIYSPSMIRWYMISIHTCSSKNLNRTRPVARHDFRECRTPESGPFGPNPLHITPFLAHFVAKVKSGPFGRVGGGHASHPLATGLNRAYNNKTFDIMVVSSSSRYISYQVMVYSSWDVKSPSSIPKKAGHGPSYSEQTIVSHRYIIYIIWLTGNCDISEQAPSMACLD